jgi:hypothetical protein
VSYCSIRQTLPQYYLLVSTPSRSHPSPHSSCCHSSHPA